MTDLKPEFSHYDAPVHPQAKEKEAYVEGMFNSVAPSYDLANRLMSFGLDKGWRKYLVKLSGVGSAAKVLDVGCGTGDLLMDFVSRVPQLDGEGLDFSAGMLEQAKRKAPALKWVQGSALALPQADNCYDAVASAWVLRSITDPQKYFSEMARVAKPGAKVLVLELTRPLSAWQRLLYWPVLTIYVPVMGTLLSGHSNGYKYLRDTIKGFYDNEAVLGFMRQAGLSDVRAEALTLGAATLYVGTKPAA